MNLVHGYMHFLPVHWEIVWMMTHYVLQWLYVWGHQYVLPIFVLVENWWIPWATMASAAIEAQDVVQDMKPSMK